MDMNKKFTIFPMMNEISRNDGIINMKGDWADHVGIVAIQLPITAIKLYASATIDLVTLPWRYVKHHNSQNESVEEQSRTR